MRCIYCGKTIEKGNYCENCLEKYYPIIKEVKKLNLKVCQNCEFVQYKNKWNKLSNELLEKILNNAIVIDDHYMLLKLSVSDIFLDIENSQILCKLTLKLKISDLKKEILRVFEFTLPFQKSYCQKCIKGTTDYYEAILQLRNVPREIYPELFQFINNLMEQKKIFITNEETVKTKNGISKDFYLTSQKFAQILAREVTKKFSKQKIETKISRKLYSVDKITSKPLYRVTVLVRFV
ncbi:MAG: NMD3-related protein [Candidatus Woesearchaeota archaeon]